jgi:hypothetical protein
MLCEHCDSACHTYCCDPPLKKVPVGPFFCSECDPVWAENAKKLEEVGETPSINNNTLTYISPTSLTLRMLLTGGGRQQAWEVSWWCGGQGDAATSQEGEMIKKCIKFKECIKLVICDSLGALTQMLLLLTQGGNMGLRGAGAAAGGSSKGDKSSWMLEGFQVCCG